jgi:hypothetical protein
VTESWISFGPDLEPMSSQARRMEGPPLPRRDGLKVLGTAQEVAEQLGSGSVNAGGWCELQAGDPPHAVHVNAKLVRFVVEVPE